MATETAPLPSAHPKLNRIGLDLAPYRAGKSTLCAGCGHNSITERIIEAFWEMGVEPHRVIKTSGIGCSGKTPAYFLGASHGFNGVHGRMPSVTTGAVLANRKLLALGISGDGDTASIGIGQFVHLMRRNLPMIYIIEDNGCYGLTKGQFSATADIGSRMKSGVVNELPPIDTCVLAIALGASFVARSFSGDKKQLGAAHRGTAMLDVISPCVTFNDHAGSTKSYSYIKAHDEPLHEIGFIPFFESIEIDYDPGETQDVRLHDGSYLRLRKFDHTYDATNRMTAVAAIEDSRSKGEVLTGILYVNPGGKDFLELLDLVDEPLATLPESRVRPSREALEQIMEELR
jgi:2-oxoglutarate ferredoxin oxidoreductase subunit beta